MAVDYNELKRNGFMRQRQENYFCMRLKVTGGQVTVKQLETIKAVAEKFGRNYIHLTSRQGIEIPYIHLNDIEAVKEILGEGGVEIGFSGPRVRTITSCQGKAICRSGLIDTQSLARKLEGRYAGKNLPHKFKFGFTGCPNNCLKAEENDIGVKGAVKPNWNESLCTFCGACRAVCPQKIITIDKAEKVLTIDREKCVCCGKCVKKCPAKAMQGEVGFKISFGGLYGNRIAVGKNILPIIFDEDKLFEVIDAAINFFAENARKGERFRNMLDRIGWEKFVEHLTQTI